MKLYLSFLLIFLIALVVFFPSFKLSLYGDDWLVFWRYNYFFPPGHTSNIWEYINHFTTRYGSQDVLMGLLRLIYDYQSTYYYITSFLFRIVAAFSLYPITYYLTKNKSASLFAIFFFSITTIGLETTEYLAHMPSYISLACFNLFLYYFLKSRENREFRKLLISGVFFYLTFVIAPIRMTGLLPFILLIEIFWILQNLNRKIIKKVFMRLSFIFFVFLFINVSGNPFIFPSQKVGEKPQSNVFLIKQTTDSLFNIFKLLQNGRFDFLSYPIISFGSMFLPDTAIHDFSSAIDKSQLFLLILSGYCLFILLTLILLNSIFAEKSKSYKGIWFFGIIWSLISSIVYLTNKSTFPNAKFFILLLIGGYITILGLYLLYRYYHHKLLFQALLVSLSWSIFSFMVPWFWDPTNLFGTYHRYLIGSAVGISLFLSIIISLARNLKYQKVLLSLFLILTLIHITTTRMHIHRLLENHNQEISSKIWSSIPYIAEVGKSKDRLIFYFEGDDTNTSIIHDVITFGFPPHMALLYNITDEEKIPTPITEWEEVVSAVKTGKTSPTYAFNEKPINPNRVYAFHLEGKNHLIDITDIARSKLKELAVNQ